MAKDRFRLTFRVWCADTERGLLDAEDMKKEALRASLDAQVAEKASKRQDEDRYDRILESRKQSEDALRYQGEVLDDMARRREAGKSLAQVWARQRELKVLAQRVSGPYQPHAFLFAPCVSIMCIRICSDEGVFCAALY